MKKLPISIDPCPILEAIFEIRFESKLPGDAIFGIVYNQFKDDYKEVEQLPVLQLPAAIRDKDLNLRYVPHYKLRKDNFVIQIGPNVFSFGNIKEYCGWGKFFKEIISTYQKLESLDMISKIERTALRYINLFPDLNIFLNTTLEISMDHKKLGNEQIVLTTKFPHEKGESILKLINFAEVDFEGEIKKGSIIDIDTVVDTKTFKNFEEIVSFAHNQEKELFFSLLEKEFLKTLNPVYEDK